MITKWKLLTCGKLLASDQVLYADYRLDCESKKRWHRPYKTYVGMDVAKLLRRYRHIKIRRPTAPLAPQEPKP